MTTTGKLFSPNVIDVPQLTSVPSSSTMLTSGATFPVQSGSSMGEIQRVLSRETDDEGLGFRQTKKASPQRLQLSPASAQSPQQRDRRWSRWSTEPGGCSPQRLPSGICFPSSSGEDESPRTKGKKKLGTRQCNSRTPTHNWNCQALVSGALYVKYGPVYALCDCSIDAERMVINPRQSHRESIEFDVGQIVETKLLNFWHYYENDMCEVVLQGANTSFCRPTISFEISSAEKPTTSTTSQHIADDAAGLPQRTVVPAPEHECKSVVEVGHQGGEGFTVLTLKAFNTSELTEWVEALRETQANADTIAEFTDSFARRSSTTTTHIGLSPSNTQQDLFVSYDDIPESCNKGGNVDELMVLVSAEGGAGEPHPVCLGGGGTSKRSSTTHEENPLSSVDGPGGVAKLAAAPPPLPQFEDVASTLDANKVAQGDSPSGSTCSYDTMRRSCISPSRSAIDLEKHPSAPLVRPVFGRGYYLLANGKVT